jgi:N-methylhydantoinase B
VGRFIEEAAMAQVTREVDPVVLEVLWNRLIAVTNEQAAALMRTSFTTIVRESEDLSAGVFDAQGRMLAQSVTGTPGHINSMATGMRYILAEYPPDTLAPGDVLITNDPWYTSGQLHDLTIATPIFYRDRLVALFASTCHAADIGGRGLSADAREVYEEGLYIPITKLYERGEPNRELFKIIRGNVRAPEAVLGDIHAQVAANDVGGRHLIEFLEEFQLEGLDELAEAIVTRSEQAMRQAIAAIPDGTYENESWSDGFEEPIRIRVAVTVRGDEMVVDYTGSSPQSARGINVVLNYTQAYTTYAVKCAISPEVPNNDGSFRPVRVTAPEGCILNAQRPAAVAGRHVIGHFLPGAVHGALAKAVPDRVMAEGSAAIWIVQTRGVDRQGAPFTYVFFTSGGTGARPTKDGLSATAFPSGIATVPTEVIESLAPLILHRRELRADSGGPGRFRGGCGQHIDLSCQTQQPWLLACMFDRTRFPARGLLGGAPGAGAEFALSTGEQPNPKGQLVLQPDTLVHLGLPGGGGYGTPFTRDPERVRWDVINGLVTIEEAARQYGVVVRCTAAPESLVRLPEDYVIDEAATAALRRGAS